MISIFTHHWNDGQGKAPGTIGLQAAGGGVLGPWHATGSVGQPTQQYPNGVPNADWTVTPSQPGAPVVIDGTYSCKDSDPSTWSANEASGGNGFCKVWVEQAMQTTTGVRTPTGSVTHLSASLDPHPRLYFNRSLAGAHDDVSQILDVTDVGPADSPGGTLRINSPKTRSPPRSKARPFRMSSSRGTCRTPSRRRPWGST